MADQNQHQSLVCMLMLKDQSALPGASSVAARLRNSGGRSYQLKWDAPVRSEDGICIQTYHLEDRRVQLCLAPMPIPWTVLEGACAENMLWPDAAEVCRQHQAQLVVGLQGEPDPIRRHLMLTDLAAAVAREADALGVYWGDGGVVQSTELFSRLAAEAAPERLPLMLWVGFYKFMYEGVPFVATEGLKSFGVMEVEGGSAHLKPMELLAKVYDLSHYLCLQGPVVKDGDTVGNSAQERFPVRYLPSVLGREETVMRVLFDPPKRPRRFFPRRLQN